MCTEIFTKISTGVLKCSKSFKYRAFSSLIEAALEEISESKCHVHELDQCPNITGKLNREEALSFFERMHFIRRMETTCGQLYQQSHIAGFCHLYSGQEACAVGIKSVMRPQDTAITSYRCHAWAFLMSEGTEESCTTILKELVGKKTGLCKGKSGSMHLFDKNFYGGNGIVGAQVSLGTGIAFAHKYNNNNSISFTMLGDGATNCGQVYESFNLALMHKLPVIYVIENNNFAMGTPTERVSSNFLLYKKFDLMPGIRINGMDVTAVRDAAKFAISHVMDGKGPIIIEFLTYRYSGHSVADPGTSYRSREDVNLIREKFDPIALLHKKMLEENLVQPEDIEVIVKKNNKLLRRAVEVAINDADPPLSDLATTVYASENPEKGPP